MAKIVILGAGLTGISAAYHLEQAGFYDYALFEKEDTIGGLCRSVQQDGFTFDFTGHLLHINNDYFRSLIESVVGLNNFEQIHRRSFIYSHKTYTNYPFQIHLKGLPSPVVAECIAGFIARKKNVRNPHSFREWVLKEFGPGFGTHFFFPYQKKIFAYSIDKLTASWTGRFVPATTLTQIIDGIMHDADQTPSVGYNAQFFYPKKGGIFYWVEKLAQQLLTPVRTHHCVKKVDLKNKIVRFSNGHSEPYDHLITTIPLDRFIDCLQEMPSTTFAHARPHLLCNSVINFNLGIRRPDMTDKHWIYFPETEFPFYRLGFPHNFTANAAPPGHSSLYGECSFLKRSGKWQQEILQRALAHTKKLLKLDQTDIMMEKIITIPHAYVIYDAWRDRHLPDLLNRLKEYNIHSVGRYGQWKYSSMQEAVLDGKTIAQTLTIMPARSTLFYQPTPRTTENTPLESSA